MKVGGSPILGLTPLGSAREQAALALTEEVTLIGESGVSNETWKRATTEFTDQDVVTLIMAICAINIWNRMAVSTGENDDAALLHALSALRRHIFLEEVFLFPPLRDAGLMMEREHGELWDSVDTVQHKHDDGGKPAAMVPTCQELLSLLNRHNSKEEPIIYSQADAALDDEANALLQEFMVSGTMPEGWVCHRAGS